MTAIEQNVTVRLRVLIQRVAAHPSNYWTRIVSDPALALFLVVRDRWCSGQHFSCGARMRRHWYHSRMLLWRVGHEMHHESPERLIGLPWFVTDGLVATCWYVVGYTLRVHAVSSGLAGFLAAWVIYGVLHHSHHHWILGPAWCRSLRVHHRIHHRRPSTNFGVTTRFWDDVFGTTYRKAPARRGETGETSKGSFAGTDLQSSRAVETVGELPRGTLH